MSLKKLPPKTADIKFINPETFAVECTYNQCFQKFKPAQDYVIKTRAIHGYNPEKFDNYYHECTECLRKYASTDDKRMNGLAADQSLNMEDKQYALNKLQKIYDLATDPYKLRDLIDAMKRIS